MIQRITLRLSGAQLVCKAGEHPSLLALLESRNIPVEYQCRAGYCGACRTRLLAGEVEWLTDPLAFVQPGEILPCCCKAAGDIEISL